MRLIAIEEHILPHAVRDSWGAAPPPHDPVSAFTDGGENGARLADLGEGRLALMDEQGDVQVLSLTTPGLHNLAPGSAVGHGAPGQRPDCRGVRPPPTASKASPPCRRPIPMLPRASWNAQSASWG